VGTQGLPSRPSEELLGPEVPGGDEALRIEGEEGLIRKTVDDEEENFLRALISARLWRLLTHDLVRVGYHAVRR